VPRLASGTVFNSEASLTSSATGRRPIGGFVVWAVNRTLCTLGTPWSFTSSRYFFHVRA